MLAIPRTVFVKLKSLRIVALILERSIIPALAFLTGQIDSDADLSATLFSHCTLQQKVAGAPIHRHPSE